MVKLAEHAATFPFHVLLISGRSGAPIEAIQELAAITNATT
jgi:hypothetical protein